MDYNKYIHIFISVDGTFECHNYTIFLLINPYFYRDQLSRNTSKFINSVRSHHILTLNTPKWNCLVCFLFVWKINVMKQMWYIKWYETSIADKQLASFDDSREKRFSDLLSPLSIKYKSTEQKNINIRNRILFFRGGLPRRTEEHFGQYSSFSR